MRTWNNSYHSVGLSNTMSKQLEKGKLNFHNIRVYVWSIQKYKFCLSVTLIVATATLLLRSPFSKATLQEMVNISLILASNLKYHVRFEITT